MKPRSYWLGALLWIASIAFVLLAYDPRPPVGLSPAETKHWLEARGYAR